MDFKSLLCRLPYVECKNSFVIYNKKLVISSSSVVNYLSTGLADLSKSWLKNLHDLGESLYCRLQEYSQPPALMENKANGKEYLMGSIHPVLISLLVFMAVLIIFCWIANKILGDVKTLEHYLNKQDPCRCKSERRMLLFPSRSGSIQAHLNSHNRPLSSGKSLSSRSPNVPTFPPSRRRSPDDRTSSRNSNSKDCVPICRSRRSRRTASPSPARTPERNPKSRKLPLQSSLVKPVTPLLEDILNDSEVLDSDKKIVERTDSVLERILDSDEMILELTEKILDSDEKMLEHIDRLTHHWRTLSHLLLPPSPQLRTSEGNSGQKFLTWHVRQ